MNLAIISRSVRSVTLLALLGPAAGCMMTVAPPNSPTTFVRRELPAADRAIEAAQAAGKANECPDEFKAVEQLRDQAYATYWACRTDEAVKMANDAVSRANALCPRKVVAPPAPPPPPPPAAPTVSIMAAPVTIERGKCATLSWNSTNVTSASIDQGLGSVSPSGSREVCPTVTTQYSIAASGAGGSQTVSTTVTVTSPPGPTVSITAAPATVQQGKCTTLSWTSANVTSASIDQGLGSVSPSGSREVCPAGTTQYSISGSGAGGSRTASTTVTVTPAPKVIDRLTIHVNFDFDKAAIETADDAELQKAIAFVKKYQGYKVSIEGYTDSIGTERYNQKLSERRATTVKDYLVKNGAADPSRMTAVGYGAAKPIADNRTKEGRFQNRRVEISILSE